MYTQRNKNISLRIWMEDIWYCRIEKWQSVKEKRKKLQLPSPSLLSPSLPFPSLPSLPPFAVSIFLVIQLHHKRSEDKLHLFLQLYNTIFFHDWPQHVLSYGLVSGVQQSGLLNYNLGTILLMIQVLEEIGFN